MIVTIPIQAQIEVSDDQTSYQQATAAKAKIEQLLQQYNLAMLLTSQGIRVRSVVVGEPVPPTPPQPQATPQYAPNGNGRR